LKSWWSLLTTAEAKTTSKIHVHFIFKGNKGDSTFSQMWHQMKKDIPLECRKLSILAILRWISIEWRPKISKASTASPLSSQTFDRKPAEIDIEGNQPIHDDACQPIHVRQRTILFIWASNARAILMSLSNRSNSSQLRIQL
jgi:hypothetical protein